MTNGMKVVGPVPVMGPVGVGVPEMVMDLDPVPVMVGVPEMVVVVVGVVVIVGFL